MDMVQEMIQQDYLRYQQALQDMEAELSQLPKGKLIFRTSRGKQYCHLQSRDAQGVHNQRVPEAEMAGVQRLLARRKILQKNIEKIQFWISVYEKNLPRLSKFVMPPDTAVFADPEKPYSTLSGIFVRSKSEVIIADALYHAPLSFSYEKPLFFPGTDNPVYPDFTISTPYQNKIVYWEHLGLADNKEYMAKWNQKERRYAAAGISPRAGNLIITQESHDAPFSLEDVMGKIAWLRQQ